MKNVKKEKRLLRATWERVATASATLCTTLVILAPYLAGGSGPKLPRASGE